MSGGAIDVEINPEMAGFTSALTKGLAGAGKVGAVALAAALAGGAVAFKNIVSSGIEYTNTLNTLQSVSGATAAQMDKVKKVSTELGNDLTLPATSAADAAMAMTELAKGGFSVEDAMTAAKGTLQLAAAAQIDAADAATIQSKALNAFGLSATEATRVADVLANGANQSAAEIGDIALALQQSGAVANQFGISIEDTTTALALFSNAGIDGSDAGTLLKTALLKLTNQGKPAQKAMEDLGVSAYDAQGNFRGLPSLFGQLQDASKRLSPEAYQAASNILFGSDAARLAGVAAQQGATGFNKMREAVGKSGAAAEVAAAKTKGLPGAIESAKSAAETFALELYDLIDGPLETMGRAATEKFNEFSEAAITGLKQAGQSMSTFSLQDSPRLSSALDHLGSAGGKILDIAKSLGSGLADMGRGATKAGGPLDTLGSLAALTAAGFDGLLTVLRPVASAVGGLASGFSKLPGPIQSGAYALVALKIATSALSAPIGAVTGAFARFGQQMAVQRGLAASAGQSLGRLGAASAALQAQSATLSSVGAGYRAVTTATGTFVASQRAMAVSSTGAIAGMHSLAAGAARMGGVVGGTAVGALRGFGTAAKNLLKSIGPVGGAIAAAVIAYSGFSSASRAAATSAEALKTKNEALADAQRDVTNAFTASRGVINADVFAGVGRQVDAIRSSMKTLGDNAPGTFSSITAQLKDLRNPLSLVTGDYAKADNAARGLAEQNGRAAKAIDSLGLSSDQLGRILAGRGVAEFDAVIDRLHGMGDGGELAAQQLGEVRDKFLEAERSAGALTPGMTDLADAISKLAEGSGTAADKANLLKQAFDALNGKQISAAEATAQYNKTLLDVAEKSGEAADQTKGFGAALIASNGQVNSSTANGQALYGSLSSLVDGYRNSANAAYDAAIAQGKSSDEARDAARSAYDQLTPALSTLAQKYGLSADQVRGLATAMGAVPDQVETLLAVRGADDAKQQITAVQLALNNTVGKTIVVTAPTEAAQNQLRAVGLVIEQVPGTKDVKITAPTQTALNQLGLINTAVDETGNKRADPQVGLNAQQFNQGNNDVLGLLGTLTSSRADPQVGLNAQQFNGGNNEVHHLLDVLNNSHGDPQAGLILDQFNSGKNYTLSELRNLSNQIANPQVRADVQQALNNIQTVNNYLGSLHDKQINVHTVYTEARAAGLSDDLRHQGMAQGGIVSAFAGGGMQFAGHKLSPMATGMATIVGPNTWRVVGDRARDDEFYIPDDGSKRSLALLNEAARRQNLALIRRFAEGGVATQAPPQSAQRAQVGGSSLTIGSIVAADPADAVRQLRRHQADAQAVVNMRAIARGY